MTRLAPLLLLLAFLTATSALSQRGAVSVDPSHEAPRGVAVTDASHWPQDRITLGTGASWWYDWRADGALSDPAYVPMAWWGQVLSSCPPLQLTGNEWNVTFAPWGERVEPSEAARRVLAIEKACPNTRQVTLGLSADHWGDAGGWDAEVYLAAFLRSYRTQSGRAYRGTVALHCYSMNTADYCMRRLTRMMNASKCYRGPWWLTEMAVLNGSGPEFARLVAFATPRFERVAVFTPRLPADCAQLDWCAAFVGSGVELVGPDGTLTAVGREWAKR